MQCKLSRWIPEIFMYVGSISMLDIYQGMGIVALAVTTLRTIWKFRNEIRESKRAKKEKMKSNPDF